MGKKTEGVRKAGTETGRQSGNGKAAGTGLDGVQVALAPGSCYRVCYTYGVRHRKKRSDWWVVMKGA